METLIHTDNNHDTETAQPGTHECMTSLVSYPTRCHLWGDAGYRGNCDGTLVKDLVLHYGARKVADPMMGSGTTRDVIAWLNRTRRSTAIGFWGGDLNTGFNLLRQNLPDTFDFIWLHPPYWNIIRYSNHPDDLSTEDDFDYFRHKLKLCLYRCGDALVPGGRLAVLVADVRRAGRYYPLGMLLMDLVPRTLELRSVIIKAQHNCRSDSKFYGHMEDVPIKHEYCLVFKHAA